MNVKIFHSETTEIAEKIRGIRKNTCVSTSCDVDTHFFVFHLFACRRPIMPTRISVFSDHLRVDFVKRKNQGDGPCDFRGGRDSAGLQDELICGIILYNRHE
jgi:hypothetical protein